MMRVINLFETSEVSETSEVLSLRSYQTVFR
jgi:hypothetical protein